MNQNPSVRKLVRCGVVAAIYVVLCMALQPLSYGAVQVRVAEALCLLPVFGAEYIAGVVLGCFLANLLGSTIVDVIFGTLATLLACLVTYKLRNIRIKGLAVAASLPPVLFNAVIIGIEIAVMFPFLGIYNAGAALFRVMGNSNISMVTSIVMNALNIIGNAVFVFGFDMGVAGVALSTLISRAFASIVILVLLHQEKYEIHCTKWFLAGWDKEMMKKIFSIGVPQALENSMFQIGKLLTQSMIAGFGTASIAANACAMTVEQLAFMPGSAMGLAMTTVVGQCVGAGDYKQARSYTKKLITGAYAFLWILNILLLAAAPLFAGAYNLSDGAYR